MPEQRMRMGDLAEILVITRGELEVAFSADLSVEQANELRNNLALVRSTACGTGSGSS